MKNIFTEIPKNENYLFCMTHQELEIGVSMVIYGFRIRAGFQEDGYCYLDYCAGAKQEDIQNIFNLCLTILHKKIKDNPKSVFDGWPIQSTKPMYNDPECFRKLCELAGSDLVNVQLPDMQAIKSKEITEKYSFLESIFNQ